MAAILTICGATMALTSCVDNDDNSTPTTTGVEQEENRTEDALSVIFPKTPIVVTPADMVKMMEGND